MIDGVGPTAPRQHPGVRDPFGVDVVEKRARGCAYGRMVAVIPTSASCAWMTSDTCTRSGVAVVSDLELEPVLVAGFGQQIPGELGIVGKVVGGNVGVVGEVAAREDLRRRLAVAQQASVEAIALAVDGVIDGPAHPLVGELGSVGTVELGGSRKLTSVPTVRFKPAPSASAI